MTSLTKSQSPTDITEKKSQAILQLKLADLCYVQFYDDKKVSDDGHIDLLDEDKSMLGRSVLFQLKATEIKGRAHYTCEKKDLIYFVRSNEQRPCVLIFVNIPDNLIYWQQIDSDYVKNILKIKNLEKAKFKTKRILFSTEKVIDGNMLPFVKMCEDIVQINSEVQVSREKIDQTNEMKSGQDVILDRRKKRLSNALNEENLKNIKVGSSGPVLTGTMKNVKNKISDALHKKGEKMMIYYGLIYLLKPFFSEFSFRD